MPTRPRRHIPHDIKLNRLPVSGIDADDICVTTDATITSTALSQKTHLLKMLVAELNAEMVLTVIKYIYSAGKK